jgi:light-regulated signal transduction histidine kinase (bacteriophytochrome)
MSHDLKTPVVSIQGMASLFLEDYGPKVDEKARHYLGRIVANTNFMEQLINDLLALSRIGRSQQNSELSDVETIVRELVEINQESFKTRGIDVVIHAPLPHFKFERAHLVQLFQNLIMNAAKFMGDQPQPKIEIGGTQTKDSVEYYVKDNGIGIDPAYHKKIFDVFQRLNDVEVEGTGIGLAVVKKIVGLAHGAVRVESQKGQGATFFVQFPVVTNQSKVRSGPQ